MAGLYGPLWCVILIVIVLYALVLFVVVDNYYRLYSMGRHNFDKSSSIFKKFGHQLLHVFRSKKRDSMLVRISVEWTACIKIIAYPGLFLLVWFPPTLNRVLQLFQIQFFPLEVVHSFTVPAHGFFAVLLFLFHPALILNLVHKYLCICMNRKSNRNHGSVSRETTRNIVFGDMNQELQRDDHGNDDNDDDDDNMTRTDDLEMDMFDDDVSNDGAMTPEDDHISELQDESNLLFEHLGSDDMMDHDVVGSGSIHYDAL